MGAIPAPPPRYTISRSVFFAKNSPNGPEIVTLSPDFRLNIYDEAIPGGTSFQSAGGGVEIRTFSIIISPSAG